MSKIDLEFRHEADSDIVAQEYEPSAIREAEKNGIPLSKPGPRTFRIHGSKMGQDIDMTTTISEDKVTVTGEVSFLAKAMVESRLKKEIPELLRRCEKLTAARSGSSCGATKKA